MITASGMYRAKKCTGSDLLTQVEETTELTEEGHAVHAFLKKLPDLQTTVGTIAQQHGKTPPGGIWDTAVRHAIGSTPEAYRARCASLDLDPIRALLEPGGFHREVPIEWLPATREADTLGRDYRARETDEPLRGDAIYGTPDLFSVVDGCAVVVDWKGRHPDGPELVKQLECYAVMVADLLGLSRARCIAVAFGDDGQPRVIDRKNGQPWVLESWDLDAIAEDAVALLERRNSLQPGEGLHAGPWCGRCPARHDCKARGGKLAWVLDLARAARVGGTESVPAMVKVAADEDVFTIRDSILSVAKSLIAEVEDEIRDRAARKPIRHPDGRVLGLKEQIGPGSINAILARALAREEGHPEPEVEMSVTKSAIEAAVGQTAPKRGKTKHVKGFMERLEARGGIKRVAKLCEWKEDPNAAAISASVQEAPPASGVAGGAPVLSPEPPTVNPEPVTMSPGTEKAGEHGAVHVAGAPGAKAGSVAPLQPGPGGAHDADANVAEAPQCGLVGSIPPAGADSNNGKEEERVGEDSSTSPAGGLPPSPPVGVLPVPVWDFAPSMPAGFLTGTTVHAEPSYGLVVEEDEAKRWAEARAKERAERIAACEKDGGHRWGRMDVCVRCDVPRFPIDKSTGHPVREGKKLCSCSGDKDCVDREVGS